METWGAHLGLKTMVERKHIGLGTYSDPLCDTRGSIAWLSVYFLLLNMRIIILHLIGEPL